MKRFILDTGIAALHLDRKRGVFERAAAEVARGNRVGIAAPVLAELAFRGRQPAAGPEYPAAPSGAGRVETLAGGHRRRVRVRPARF